jgi:hypothetical protein
MPRNFPIGFWCLVKQDAPHRKALLAETGSHELFNWFGSCQLADDWNVQQIPLSVSGIAKV